jgi:hypothetical protein
MMRTLLSLSLVCLVATVAFARPQMTGGSTDGYVVHQYNTRTDPVIWDNGAASAGAGSSQNDTVYPFNSHSADDFRLADQNGQGDGRPYLVTDVHWTGTYWNPGVGQPSGFNVMFFANNGGVPTGGGQQDPTGTAILNQFVPLGATNQTATGNVNEFRYNTKLQVPFLADRNTTYWLSVQSQMNFPPQWGWNFTATQKGNGAVLGFPLLAIPYWTNWVAQGAGPDMSFQLTGFKVPEPASLGLLALGGLAVIRRRR